MMNTSNSNHLPSNELLSWLSATGSLTALLEKKAGQPLKVEPTFEGYRRLSLPEKQQLGLTGSLLSRPMMGWIREVLLYGDDTQPWVSAQSIFPIISLKGNAKRLKNLKSTPIGYLLFSRQKQLPNQRCILATTTGWKRQTVYNWHGRKIIIAETFLPAFLDN